MRLINRLAYCLAGSESTNLLMIYTFKLFRIHVDTLTITSSTPIATFAFVEQMNHMKHE